MTITTQKERVTHNLGSLLDRLVGVIIQEMLRYRSKILPVTEGDSLTWASVSSELEQTKKPFGFYRGKRLLRPWQPNRKGAQQQQRYGMVETTAAEIRQKSRKIRMVDA